MVPHKGPCQVLRTNLECFFCRNRGHVVTVCNHKGAQEARANVPHKPYKRACRQQAQASGERSAAVASAASPTRLWQPLQMKVWVAGQEIEACADSGSTRVCIEEGLLRRLHPSIALTPWTQGKVATFQGEQAMAPVGEAQLEIAFTADGTIKGKTRVLVFRQLFTSLIIGIDLLTEMRAHIKLGPEGSTVTIGGHASPVQPFRKSTRQRSVRLYTSAAVQLERGLQMVRCRFHGSLPTREALLEPRVLATKDGGLQAAAAAAVYSIKGSREIEVCVLAPRNGHIRGRTWIGSLVTMPDEKLVVAGMQWPLGAQAASAEEIRAQGARTVVAMAAASAARSPDNKSAEVWTAIKEQLAAADSGLTAEQRKQLEELFWEHRAQFVTQLREAGRADIQPFEIHLEPDARPPRMPPVRMGPKEAALMGQELDELLKMGAVRPAAGATPFAAPMMLVPKAPGPDGEPQWRVVIDYRALNKITKREVYPLPDRRDVLDRLGQAKYFTTFDLASGYWQQPLREEDIPKTAFSVPGRGLFEWLVTAMGFTNAPPNFQRAMEVVLSGLSWECCLVFIDDIIIFSATWEDHLRDVDSVLRRLKGANLKVKITKCQIARTSVKFLGAIVSSTGVRPDPKKVEAIVSARRPATLGELRSWLGLCTWLRPYGGIEFANAIQPLYDTLQKGKEWQWSPECEAANERVKELLTSAPILVHPDFSKPFTVYVDASDQGYGGILFQQQQNGVGGVVAYHSGRWSAAESKYSVSEMETLALVNLSREWRPYLFGTPFTVLVRSDHSALPGILSSTRRDHGRFDRMRIELQAFSYKVEHIPGAKNPADTLTRAPVMIAPLAVVVGVDGHARPEQESATREAHPAATLAQVGFKELRTTEELVEAQRADESLRAYLHVLDKDEVPPGLTATQATQVKDVAQRMGFTKEGVLFIRPNVPQRGELRRGEGLTAQLVVPTVYRQELLQAFHERLAHLKAGRMFETIRHAYWWPSLRRDTDEWCANCADCQRTNRDATRKDCGVLHPIAPQWAGQVVAMDIAECGEGDGGYRYFIIAVDLFTRWVEGRMLVAASAEAVRDFLEQEWVCRHGRPHTLLTDNGSNMISAEMAAYTLENHIVHHRSTAYNPEENGSAEHVVKMVKAAIRASVAGHQKDWPRHFYKALQQARTAYNEAIGMSPYFACYGRSLDQGLPIPLRPLRALALSEGSVRRSQQQAEIEAELRDRQAIAKDKQKKYYDQRHTPATFKVGDLVLKKKERNQPGEVRSLEQAWEGPFEVTSVAGEGSNVITIRNVANAADERTAAANQLKHFRERADQRLEAPRAEDEYEVEDIWQELPLGTNGKQYLVKWKGYTPKHMTWEPASAIPEGNPVLEAFKKRPEQERVRPPRGKTVPKCVLARVLREELGHRARPATSQREGTENQEPQVGEGVITRSGRKVRLPKQLQEQLIGGMSCWGFWCV